MEFLGRKSRSENNKIINILTNEKLNSPVSEQYRLIRTNLQFTSVDKEIQSILITSPELGDGKTTTAANLAIVIAHQGKRVLLVDADLRKPTLHYAFKTDNTHGLTSVLANSISLEKAISKTHISGLEVLTSGPIPPNPSELLDSKAMEKIIANLREAFDYIIFDSSPVLTVTDSQVMANHCDGIVMVAASKKTHKDNAVKAKDLLKRTNSIFLGVVLTGVEPVKHGNFNNYK
ncbi:CpsD/CapB family tyrosine-protein kinase [Priestia megaterium]|uniref:CpsD/CapB family tyrosine-protein kinase n=1 Tax=Priestia megaterium TaxID=1404 RepID=UPI0027BAB8AB|nr:CpsD/CapB family tyrosine-protein kinase [Priestia megaterium]